MESTQNPFPPGDQPNDAKLAIRAWNIMGGLDWSAIYYVAEMLGIVDIELLIEHLVAIREFSQK